MKNALLLLSIWVGILVAAYALVYWDGAEAPIVVAAAAPQDVAYADPQGRFSLTYPPSWEISEDGESVSLMDPSGRIEVTAHASEEEVPEVALLHALGMLDQEGGEDPPLVREIPPVGQSERGVKMLAPKAEAGGGYGLAYAYDGWTLVVLVRGPDLAVGGAAGDLARIEAGISVPAATRIDAASEGEPVEL